MFLSYPKLPSAFVEAMRAAGFRTSAQRRALLRQAAAAGTWARWSNGAPKVTSSIQVDVTAATAANFGV